MVSERHAAPITTSEQFFALLEQSRLLSEPQWSEFRKAAPSPTTPQRLAEELVARRWISSWQARQLLVGDADFFLIDDKYKLLEKLGIGGMGTVYKAENTRTKRMVALKVLSQDAVNNAEAKARFEREIQAIIGMESHENVVAAYGADWKNDTYVFEMEYVKGHNLSQWLHRYGPLPVGWGVECIRQAALGLEHAHRHGIVHRDIKPGNILVVAENPHSAPQVKILDMGLARVRDDSAKHLTRQGQVLGTPIYMAPEQALDTRNADIRCDLYALGATLFRILTGKYPFPGESPMDQIQARLNNPPPRIRELRPDVPAELEEVICKIMARDPGERYQTPQELVEALAPFAIVSRMQAAAVASRKQASPLGEHTPGGGSSLTINTETQRQLDFSGDETTLRPHDMRDHDADAVVEVNVNRTASWKKWATAAAVVVITMAVVLGIWSVVF